MGLTWVALKFFLIYMFLSNFLGTHTTGSYLSILEGLPESEFPPAK
jgi:hypothetical protein